MTSPIVVVDDKHVPLYRIVWVADLPHFCGEEDCEREGEYEIFLEAGQHGESVWTNQQGRDAVVESLRTWCGDPTDNNDSSFWININHTLEEHRDFAIKTHTL